MTRQAFEDWYCEGNKRAIERSGGGYKLMHAHSAWTTWQACTKATAAGICTWILEESELHHEDGFIIHDAIVKKYGLGL